MADITDIDAWLAQKDGASAETPDIYGGPAGNPIDDWLKQEPAPDISIQDALRRNPDESAKLQRLADDSGLPVEAVEAQPKQVEDHVNLSAIGRLLEGAPTTSNFLTNPYRAQVAVDAVEDLTLYERVVSGFMRGYEKVVSGFMRGKLTHERGELGMSHLHTRSPEALLALEKNKLRLEALGHSGDGFATRARLYAAAMALPFVRVLALSQQRTRSAEALRALEENRRRLEALGHSGDGFVSYLAEAATIVGQQVASFSGLTAAARMGTGAAIGAGWGAVGGPLAPVTAAAGGIAGLTVGTMSHIAADTFEVEAGNFYADLLEQGVEADVAAWASMGVGFLNASLELTGAAVVLKPFVQAGKKLALKQGIKAAMKDPKVLDAVRQFAVGYGSGVGAEVGTEVLQEAVNISMEELAKSFSEQEFDSVTSEEIMERLAEIAIKTFKGMVILNLPGPSVNLMINAKRARRARGNLPIAKEASKVLKRSKLTERAPDVAREHAAQALEQRAGVKHVFIPVAKLDEFALSQEVSPDDLYTDLGVLEQAEEARLLGGDIRLSGRQYLQITLSDAHDQIAEHVRFDVDDMTAAEAEEFKTSGMQEEIDALDLEMQEFDADQDLVSRDTFVEGGRPAPVVVESVEALYKKAEELGEPLPPNALAFTDLDGQTYLLPEETTSAMGIDRSLYEAHEFAIPEAHKLIDESSELAEEIMDAVEREDTDFVKQGTIDYYNDAVKTNPNLNRADKEAEVVIRELALQELAHRESQGEALEFTPEAEERVAVAENQLGLRQFFRTAQESGLSPSDYQKYLVSLQRAADAARTREERKLLERDLKYTRGEQKKALEKAQIEVAESVNQRPVYAAINGIGAERLDRGAIVALLGEEFLAQLPKQSGGRVIFTPKGVEQRLAGKEKGLDPQTYAELYGYESADIMLFAMADAPAIETVIKAEAKQRMKELNPELVEQEDTLQTALEALHNDNQAEVLAFELNQLREAQKEGKLKAKAVRHAARQRLRNYTVAEATPAKFLAAEQREAKAAAKALRKGNREEAAQAKFRQLMNFEMAREAFTLRSKIDKQRKYLRAFFRPRKAWKAIPPDYLDAIRSLLADFNLGARLSGKKRVQLEAWALQKAAEGVAVEMPDRIAREEGTTKYQDLTLGEWAQLYETVKALDHQGRREKKLLLEAEKREKDEIALDIAKLIETNFASRGRVVESQLPVEKVKRYGRQVVSTLLNADSILRQIDGWESMGTAYQHMKGGFDEAYTEGYHPGQIGYVRRQRKAAQRVVELFSVYTKKERGAFSSKEAIPGLDIHMSKAGRIAVMLNSGNVDNIAAMVETGMFTEEELQALHNFADKKDWDFVQSVWDYLEEFWPEVKETTRRRRGFTPERVEALPVQTKFGVYRGGYYPIRYDNKLSILPSATTPEELLESVRFGHFVQSHTRRTHTEQRVGHGGRKVSLDLFAMYSHLDQVIYDLEVGDAIADTYKILHHKAVKDAFAQQGHIQKWESLDMWFGDMVTQELRRDNFVENSFRWMRTGFTVSKLGWNVSTMLLQTLGLFNTGALMGWRPMLDGLTIMMSSSWAGENSIYKFVESQTGFMEQRTHTYQKDIMDAVQQIKDSLIAKYTPGNSAKIVAATFFYGILKFQRFVDHVTWLGGKKQGMELFDGDNVKANRHANRMVARSQGSGNLGERTALERGTVTKTIRQTEFVRAFTPLISYFMAKTNIAFERTGRTNFSIRHPLSTLLWTIDILMLYLAEAMMVGLLRQEWPTQDDDPNDEGWEDWLKYMAKEMGTSIMAGVPIFRELSAEIEGYRGGGVPSVVWKEISNLYTQMSQGEIDTAFTKHLNSTAGIFLRYPSSQLNKTGETISSALSGEEVAFIEYLMGPHWEPK